MNTPATLRAYLQGDLPILHTIRSAAFAPVFQSFRDLAGPGIADIVFATAEDGQARHLDDIAAPGSGHELQVVERDGEIVGFVSFRLHNAAYAEIGLNAIDPAHAGQGIGAWMYGEVLAELKRRGVTVVSVATGLDASHEPARRAYEKVGFRPGVTSVEMYLAL